MLSVLIVNFFSGKWLKGCLRSVYDHTKDTGFEVIVISNSQEPELEREISALYPRLRWVQMEENSGFARANNAGMENAGGDTFLLLNADTELRSNALKACYDFLQAHPDAVAVGTELIFADGSAQISGSNVKSGGLNYLMLIPYFGMVLSSLAKSAGVKKPGVENAGSSETEVDWINGAFLMVKRSAVEKAGKLDEDFFLYHEEAEWCSRLKKFGKLFLLGGEQVIHFEGGTSNEVFKSNTSAHNDLSDKKGLQLLVSLWLRIRKEFGTGWFILHVLIFTAVIPFVMLLAMFDYFVVRPRAESAVGFINNTFKAWKYVPDMLFQRNKLFRSL